MKINREIAYRLGLPLSPLYAGLMRWRASAYRRGWLASDQLPVPVISVGNLTMGGTGKTPLVMAVARILLDAGRRPAVVSRGYGGTATAPVNLVGDGQYLFLDAAQAGDEPRLLAESLPGVAVATGVKRSSVARFVIDNLGVDAIILDDGFQHLGVSRDLDLVLFKGPEFLGNGRVFPGGDLREPMTALARAQAFVLTGSAPADGAGENDFCHWLEKNFPGRPIFSAPYQAGNMQPGNNRAGEPLAAGTGLLAFCGLARPESFRQMLLGLGLRLTAFRAFPDHHPYSAADLMALGRELQKTGATALVTTAKDLVKLRRLECPWPLYVLPVELKFPDSFTELVRVRL
jgi:tetraacyldisaccharide 4'-kinase